MNLPPLEVSELCLSKPHAIPELQSMVLVQELQGGAVLQYFNEKTFSTSKLQLFLFFFLMHIMKFLPSSSVNQFTSVEIKRPPPTYNSK